MTMSDDDFLPAVNAKLTAIAAGSDTPPSWYGDWMRLRPESNPEERLAVHQAIRDSGCLPDEAGFCLVAWCVEGMADREAETSLRNLVDRMEAIEKAYGLEEGQPWPNDQVPEGYEELSQEYQDAWDEIFVRKLEACGEPELADLCSARPGWFDRCYEIGLQYLLGPIKAGKATAPDELVRLTSSLDVPHAELARLALAREEIPAAFGNANFLACLWHYSNAVGGVTIHVRNKDARRARKVLTAARARPSVSLPPWICVSCGQPVAGQWDACWQCGHLADGTLAGPSPRSEGQPHGPAEPCDPFSSSLSITRSEVSKAIVRRAWQCAVFGVLGFPLLGFPLACYSMRLLWKLGKRDTPLGCGDNWRCWTAFFLNIVMIPLFLAFAGLLLQGFLGGRTR